MFENIINFFKRIGKKEQIEASSKDTAKERLHLVLMQDRANVSADFLDMMRQEIIEVIKKYIDVDENDIDVRLTNRTNDDGTTGAPALYANIPITGIKEEAKKEVDSKTEELKSHKEDKNNDKTVTETDIKTDEQAKEKLDEKTENSENIVKEEQKNGVPEKGQKDKEEKEQPIDKVNSSKKAESSSNNGQAKKKNNGNSGSKSGNGKNGKGNRSINKDAKNDKANDTNTTSSEKAKDEKDTVTKSNEE